MFGDTGPPVKRLIQTSLFASISDQMASAYRQLYSLVNE